MRRIIFLASLALTAGVLVPGSALSASGGSGLPVKGAHSGDVTTDLATGQTHLVSSGPVSHFGLATTEQYVQLVPTAAPGTFNWSGTWTVTAANGDQMSGSSTGTLVFTDATHATSAASYTSSGGTGRFAEASLTLVGTARSTRVSVVGTIAAGVFEATLVGRLSYR